MEPMEPKKISFGFSKINKKLNLLTKKATLQNETKVELIKCLEGQEIKLVEEKPEEQPLIIPLKETQKTSAALASLIKRRAVLLGEEELEQTNLEHNIKTTQEFKVKSNNESEDIEKRAARELLSELQANGSSEPSSNLVLPIVKPDDLPLEGAKESSLDDYESIPIQDFGKAMLRGMGWTEPPKVSVKRDPPVDETPMVRPKGMGLGADKALKKQPLLVAPELNEVLEVKRNAYVRILGGKHKDFYGQIEGFDDHAGRVIVKMAIGGFKEAFNEFLCQPVSRKEYAQYGKCINSTKYEEYKKKENEFGQIILKKDEQNEFDKNSKDQRKIKTVRRNSSDIHAHDYKYHKNRDEKERKSEIYKDGGREKNKEDEKHRNIEYKSEQDGGDEKDLKKDGEKEKHRENAKGHNRDKDKEGEFRREKDRDYDRDHKRENYRDDDRDRREKKRIDENERRKDLNRDDERERKRNKDRYGEKEHNRERDRYESKHDDRNQRTQSYKDNRDTQRDSHRYRARDYYKDNRDEQKHRDRNTRRKDKVKQLDESTDSDSHESKHKKLSRKDTKSKKKSKKSKKSKSKNDTSDSEASSSSSSSDSSSDSEEEKRKTHKKKTKKSKKQRERSRSRGRR